MNIDYSKLPNTIKDGVLAFRNEDEKLVYTISAITAISGCFSTFTGLYDGHTVHANLYTFISAPAGSGKSAMKYAKNLAEPIHKSKQVISFKATANNASNAKNATAPPNDLLFIPGNSSSAGIIKTMSASKHGNILIETEADTLSQVLAKDYGNFSDLLRKAFHHETISYLRSTNNEYISIDQPKLSVLLTGTPDQIRTLIPNVVDGLYSRFIFLSPKGDSQWRNVFRNSSPVTDTIKIQAAELLKYYKEAKKHSYKFTMQQSQKDQLNARGTMWLNAAKTYGDSAMAIAKRHGLILYRICMVFSILRHFENKKTKLKVDCSNDDLALAIEVTNMFFESSLQIFCTQSKQTYSSKNIKLEFFYDALPVQYSVTTDLKKAAENVGLCERTGWNYHNELKKRGRVKLDPKLNQWQKIK